MTRLTAIMAVMWRIKTGVPQAQTETGNCPSDLSINPSMTGTVHSPSEGDEAKRCEEGWIVLFLSSEECLAGHDLKLYQYCLPDQGGFSIGMPDRGLGR